MKYPIFSAGDVVRINGIRYEFGSIVSSAYVEGECPIRAIDLCRKSQVKWPHNGHYLHWLSPCLVGLFNSPRPLPSQVISEGVELGDTIRFEGLMFTLLHAPNDNIELIEQFDPDYVAVNI